ncbi:cupin domain-containing protein [Halomonas sp. WWR20]
MTEHDVDEALVATGLASGQATSVTPETLVFEDDGAIPNTRLPTLHFRSQGPAARLDGKALAERFERLYAAHGWPPSWRGGVYNYHHYHSTAHEALAVVAGRATLRLGGASGQDVEVKAGDLVVLPAGTGHCRLSASEDFEVTAAYPQDQSQVDLLRADPAEHDAAVARIARVSRPQHDPLGGELSRWWS